MYQSDSAISAPRHLKAIQKSLCKFQILSKKFVYSDAIYNYLSQIASKFEFSTETIALGIYMFNFLYDKKESSRNQYFEEMEFFSSVCLIAGAKSIELDKNIPYFSRYRRYAEKSHTEVEYESVEM